MIGMNIMPRFRRCCSLLLPSYYLLVLLFILFMAIDADHESSASSIILFNNSSPPFPLLSSLKAVGYTHMARILAGGGFDHAAAQSNSTDLTIFAPPDHALTPYLNSPLLAHFLLFHASPLRLPYNDLLRMKSGVRIPSLLEHHPIAVAAHRKFGGKECGGITLGGRVKIVHPDLYSDSNIVVHGIDRVLDLDRLQNFPKRRMGKRVQKKARKAAGKVAGFFTCGRDLYLPYGSVLMRDSNPGPVPLPRFELEVAITSPLIPSMSDFDWLSSTEPSTWSS